MLRADQFLKIALPPQPEDANWLEGAVDGVAYVVENSKSEDIILYANPGKAWIYSALVKLGNVTPPDFDDLYRCHVAADSQWMIEHSWGGGEEDEMYLASPLDAPGCKSLKGGEQLVFRRHFRGVDKGATRTELSQPLVQALGLYWLDEESAYCKLDDDGDVEPIIRVIDMSRHTGALSDVIVTIDAHQLHRYMAVTETALVMKFDFTRVPSGSFFRGWQNPKRGHYAEGDLFYHSGVQANCSFVHGSLILRPALTKAMMINRSRRDWDDEDKEYATFKAQDWKNERLAEISCSPKALASYFEKDSPLPFQTTPAFFRPEVLQKYKADPEKYTLEHRSIHSRGGWYLKSYDVNEAGQVHAYLCDLAMLPYKEQLYWQSFNEWPKAAISRRAFETDFQGKFSTIEDPLLELKCDIEKLDQAKPDWWLPRGKELAAQTHYPITASPEEWSNSLLALDQLLVEGLAPKALRARLKSGDRPFEKDWASVRLLQECLTVAGIDDDEARDLVEPLKQLHYLRTKVKGHAAGERDRLIKAARTEHGSLAAHFRALATNLWQSFDRITELLQSGVGSALREL